MMYYPFRFSYGWMHDVMCIRLRSPSHFNRHPIYPSSTAYHTISHFRQNLHPSTVSTLNHAKLRSPRLELHHSSYTEKLVMLDLQNLSQYNKHNII